MKLNLWQILGGLLVLGGLVGILFFRGPADRATPPTDNRPTTQPATAPLPLATIVDRAGR